MPGTKPDEDAVLAALADARRTLETDGVPDLGRLQRLVAGLTAPKVAVLDELQSLVDELTAARARAGSSLQRLSAARTAGSAYARRGGLHR